ncbi:cytochrome o ubiquinol oxidase subunit IV [Cupriavidus plantarum]|uniref:cytochrome o ubiquinol oxidase subunit IV n=1 Tax=Cupriavidus plantarum TaxID=942865 RepID=UPI000EB4B170|nr:cytochrome o ubiquinol oxidase subunit IV [Cupriavidus plantarum]RLK45559.1 cytochrome bo3 quinol oxidase subunit 4 [Cupriavidus plantarum]
MSTHTLHTSPRDSHAHHDSHGSLTGYVIGFLLCLLLTFASFGAVMYDVVPRGMGLATIVVLCVAQLLVQLVFFLHLGGRPGQRFNTGIFLCTMFAIVIVVAGSLWVMHNATVNMMPTHMTIERAKAKD